MQRLSSDRISRFAQGLGTMVPDAMSASVILLLIVAGAALAFGNTFSAISDAYYRGLWMLLPFTMQMTLILVLSSVVSGTPLFRRLVVGLAGWPRTLTQVIALGVVLEAALSYLYWGLGVALAPLIAIHFSAAAEKKGIPVDFPFLLATIAAAQSVWQFGLSASAPLLMATPGHFLQETVGVMDLRTTIWSAPALLMVITFPAGVILVARLLMPRQVTPLSRFPEASALVSGPAEPAAAEAEPETSGFAAWIERSPLVAGVLAAALFVWLYHHFVTRRATLDLNAMNTMLLVLAVVLYRNVASFTKAIRAAVSVCWPVLVLYHLYAGVAGLLQVHERGRALRRRLRRLGHAAHVSVADRCGERDRVDLHPVERRAVGGPGLRHVPGRGGGRHDGAAGPAGVERRGPCRQPGVALLAGAARRDCAGRLPHVLRVRRDLRPALVRARRRPRYRCTARMTEQTVPVAHVCRIDHFRSRVLMSTYAASTSSARAAESTSRPGRSFTWRPRLPVPSSRRAESFSNAPKKKPTLT